MKPKIPPRVVRLASGKTIDQIASDVGVTERHVYRLLDMPWERWTVEIAQRFCQSCGLDFHSLALTPELGRRIEWDRDDSMTRLAIRDFLAMHNRPYSSKAVTDFAAQATSWKKEPEEAQCGSRR